MLAYAGGVAVQVDGTDHPSLKSSSRFRLHVPRIFRVPFRKHALGSLKDGCRQGLRGGRWSGASSAQHDEHEVDV
jgi:hypothetical protein